MPSSLMLRPAPHRHFAELSVVALAHQVITEEGALPEGSRGTVVGVYASGDGYEVEFFEPFHAIVTLGGSDLTA